MKLGNVVWITGAGSENGLGYAIAEELEIEGYGTERFDKKIEGGAIGHVLDITDEYAVEKAFDSLEKPFAIVNCAGVNITGKFLSYSLENLRKTFEVNVFGNFIFTKAFVEATLEYDAPKYIINIGSDSANTPRTNSFAYCASKAGIQMFTRCFSRDLASMGYRTIELDPSLILDTNMDIYINNEAARIQGQTEEQIKRYRMSKVPIGRFATTWELAKWIPFILKNGEYANGSCIRVTGGVI